MTRVACCQLATDVEHPDQSAARTREAIAQAVAGGGQIVVVTELSNSGYVFNSEEEVRAAAIGLDDPLFQGWAAEADRGDAIVVGGFCEQGSDGQLYNSAALLDGGGIRAVYRKLHLWDREQLWFTPGDQPAPVVETRHGRIGVAICYDIEFPELSRGLALEGADLIAFPTNWPHEESRPDERAVVHSLAAITAYQSKVFVALCDRCGAERGIEFEGGSVITGPDGAFCAGPIEGRGSEILFADLDLDQAREKRVGDRNDAFADRRPNHYAKLLTESYVKV